MFDNNKLCASMLVLGLDHINSYVSVFVSYSVCPKFDQFQAQLMAEREIPSLVFGNLGLMLTDPLFFGLFSSIYYSFIWNSSVFRVIMSQIHKPNN